jgi:ketosteroid isomerase-like protein
MSAIVIAANWFAAFNKQNVDDLLSLYDDKAEHFSPRLMKNYPETKGLIKGKSAMRDWWQGAFDKMPSLRYHPIEIREENDIVFLEYKRTVDGEEDQIVKEYLQIKAGKIIFSNVLQKN